MFFRTRIISNLNSRFTWMCIVVFLPAIVYSQEISDSAQTVRDSLQDARMDRIEWQADRRMDRFDEDQARQDGSLDSMGTGLELLLDQVEKLDRDGSFQAEQLEQLEEELERMAEASRAYQDRLRNTLWISASFLLLLLIVSFLILYVYGLNTRVLLDRFRRRQKQWRKSLSQDMDRQEEVFLDALSSQNVRIKEEMKRQRKELRAEIRSESRAARKKALKAVAKSFKGLKIKKKKS